MRNLEHPRQPDLDQLLTHQAYYQLIHTLFTLLPRRSPTRRRH
jgi:hypothetical protein